MNICFIGQLFPKENEFSDKRISNAAQLYQEKFIRLSEPEIVVSIIPIFFEKPLQSRRDDKIIYVHNLKKYNNKFLKRFLKLLMDTFECIKQISKTKADIWFYNLNLSTVFVALYVKVFSKRKLFIIIADFTTNAGIINSFINSVIAKFNGAIVLNSNISIVKNREVLPGLLYAKDIVQPKEALSLNKKILLSGSLGTTTGLNFALDFFSKNKDYDLYITGRLYKLTETEFSALISDYSKFSNIHFLGQLPYSDYLEVLDECDIALSLRDPNEIEHDFNFPSKILEYLSRNKFVISSKEYKDLSRDVLFVIDYQEQKLSEALNKIYKMSSCELKEKKFFIYNEIKNKFSKEVLIKAIDTLSKN